MQCNKSLCRLVRFSHLPDREHALGIGSRFDEAREQGRQTGEQQKIANPFSLQGLEGFQQGGQRILIFLLPVAHDLGFIIGKYNAFHLALALHDLPGVAETGLSPLAPGEMRGGMTGSRGKRVLLGHWHFLMSYYEAT